MLTRVSDREVLGKVFTDWIQRDKGLKWGAIRIGRTCAGSMASLRKMNLLKSWRVKNTVVCVFATTPGDFPSTADRRQTQARVVNARRQLEESKWGVSIYPESIDDRKTTIQPGQDHGIVFTIVSSSDEDDVVVLSKDIEIRGANAQYFKLANPLKQDLKLNPYDRYDIKICFHSRHKGLARAMVVFSFTKEGQSKVSAMARYIKLRSGDQDMHARLQPTKPYTKRKGRLSRMPRVRGKVVPPPKGPEGLTYTLSSKLPPHKIPRDLQDILETGELDPLLAGLKSGDFIESYGEFWQHLLWASEQQAKRDMTLFDIENARLSREGKYYRLRVPGLAEGRPSVLRGDTVFLTFEGKRYLSRVQTVREVEILIAIDKSFGKVFRTDLDTVYVRFSFSRMTFRTSHTGCLMAPNTMGKQMLFPSNDTHSNPKLPPRDVPVDIKWANRDLNEEQKNAVQNILRGSARPLPYIIFGPPGTGKYDS